MCGGLISGLFAYVFHVIQGRFCYKCVRLLSVRGMSVAFLIYLDCGGVCNAAWAHIQQQVFGAEIRHLWVLYGIIAATP